MSDAKPNPYARTEQRWVDFMAQLAVRRLSLGWSQEKVGQLLGCQSGYINKCEIGLKHPSAILLYRWIEVLGCRMVIVPYPQLHWYIHPGALGENKATEAAPCAAANTAQ